jgi:RimJ/RimL family protein N-acetyltransferase
MIHREDDALIGHCGLEPSRDDGALLSYALSKDYWCKGLVPEACRAVLRYGFGELGLEEIWTATSPDNRAWRSMMEKLGMGLRETERFGNGEEVVRYSVSRQGFLSRAA